jgi:hypothetical protein
MSDACRIACPPIVRRRGSARQERADEVRYTNECWLSLPITTSRAGRSEPAAGWAEPTMPERLCARQPQKEPPRRRHAFRTTASRRSVMKRALMVALFLGLSWSSVACSSDQPGAACSDGNCKCESGQTCHFQCTNGNCAHDCAAGSTCTSECKGGSCRQSCTPGATCDFSCSGGNCQQACLGSADCSATCGSGCTSDVATSGGGGGAGMSGFGAAGEAWQ